jgi:hypothetical protein
MEKKAVFHGVQKINSWYVETVYWRSHRRSTSANDEFVVVKEFRLILPVFSPDSFGLGVNPRRETVCQNLDTGELSAMRKVLPIRSFSAQEEWKSTNAEIWKRVGQNNGDAGRGVKFMCSKGGADASVTAADDEDR